MGVLTKNISNKLPLMGPPLSLSQRDSLEENSSLADSKAPPILALIQSKKSIVPKQSEGKRNSAADSLLAHGALKGRPDERHGGIIQLNPTDDVLH